MTGCHSGEPTASSLAAQTNSPSPKVAPVVTSPTQSGVTMPDAPTAVPTPNPKTSDGRKTAQVESVPTEVPTATPVPLGGSTAENQSGRWLQVDAYAQDGTAIDTLNLKDGSTVDVPEAARVLEIRVNGHRVNIDRGQMKVRINAQEDWDVVQ